MPMPITFANMNIVVMNTYQHHYKLYKVKENITLTTVYTVSLTAKMNIVCAFSVLAGKSILKLRDI